MKNHLLFLAVLISVTIKANALVLFSGLENNPAANRFETTGALPELSPLYLAGHFQTVWSGNGLDHQNIKVYLAKIDGTDLEAGDEIGIFDGTKCVGAGILTGIITSQNMLEMVASRDDGSGNGFTAGNNIAYKFYDKSKDKEIGGIPVKYSNFDPSWDTTGKFISGASSFIELSAVTKLTQEISLNTGWNLISACVIPDSLKLMTNFQLLITGSILQKVMDETGKTIENYGAFGGWKNNIGNWLPTEGYKVKVGAASKLTVTGTPIALPLDIPLSAGWNLVSYPSSTQQDAMLLFQPLIDQSNLKKVMDESGRAIENFGAFGGWKNSIGDLLPGRGFKVNVLAASTLRVTAMATTLATVTTSQATALTVTTASAGGNITNNGGSVVTARGVCWNTSTNPTIANSKTINGTGSGAFTSTISPLIAGITYYIRSYAINGKGTAYGNEITLKIPVTPIIFNPDLTYGTVSDVEGNAYKTIQIGTQVWMAENLKTTKYNDGTAIPNVTVDTTWATLKTDAYCWYNNDAATYKSTYGARYNWYAVNTNKLCPTGWHVANYAEWATLRDYLGGLPAAGAKVKETGFTHWASPNTGATNSSGFSALPGGLSGWDFGTSGWFWSSQSGVCIRLPNDYPDLWIYGIGNDGGASVRCLNDNLVQPKIPTISTQSVGSTTTTTATSGGKITADGGAPIIARGVCWSTTQNPTIAGSKTMDSTGTGSFVSKLTSLSPNTTYYVRAYATNSVGTAYGNEISVILKMNIAAGNISDVDGNVYKTVTIGSQTWMAENLRTKKYRDGTPIPYITDYTMWANLTSGAYCYFFNSPSVGAIYGSLYNYFAVIDNHNLCPAGWHVPSDAEWTILLNYLGGKDVAGGKMKEVGTVHFEGSNTGADNSSGFNAIGGGWRGDDGSFYYSYSTVNDWWSSNQVDANNSWFYSVAYNSAALARGYGAYFGKKGGLSVRCLKGEAIVATVPATNTSSVTVVTSNSASSGGNITSDGGMPVTERGVCWSTSHNPTTANDKTANGSGAGSFVSSMVGLSSNTTYYIRAYATNSIGTSYGNETSVILPLNVPGANISDVDGNVYKTVIIGTQTWMAENLKTTNYRDGTPIPYVTDGTAWSNLTNGAYCYYANDPSNVHAYGALYSWFTVADSHNVCPVGWHTPSSNEVGVLISYLGGSAVAGGKLKETGTSHWTSPNTGATNSSGFTGLPGGHRNYFGNFPAIHDMSGHWTTTESGNFGATYNTGYDHTRVDFAGWGKSSACSIRCVKD